MAASSNVLELQALLDRNLKEKMENLILNPHQSQPQVDLDCFRKRVDVLNYKSEEMTVFIKIIADLKVSLSHARLDLERSGKENSEKLPELQRYVVDLEKRLENLSDVCSKLYFPKPPLKETYMHGDVMSRQLKTVYRGVKCASTILHVKKQPSVVYSQGKALIGLQKDVGNVLRYKTNETIKGTVKRLVTPPAEGPIIERLASISVSNEHDVGLWSALTKSKESSESEAMKKQQVLKGKTLAEYNETAYVELLKKFEQLYNEDIKNVKETENLEGHANVVANNSLHESSDCEEPPNMEQGCVEYDEQNHDAVLKKDSLSDAQKTFHEELSWMEGRKVESYSGLKKITLEKPFIKKKGKHPSTHLDKRQKMLLDGQLLNHPREPRPVSSIPRLPMSEKKKHRMTMKQAVMKARVVKLKTCMANSYYATSSEVFLDRIERLLGKFGIQSANKNIAVDSVKILGQLNCSEKFVLGKLKTLICSKKKDLFTYECSKSLLLLGCWHEPAMQVLTYHLSNGSQQIQRDVLDTIRKSKNANCVAQTPTLEALLNTLSDSLTSSDRYVAFKAALCFGHLYIDSTVARQLLLAGLGVTFSVNETLEALSVLVNQMDCSNERVIESLLSQITNSTSWKSRCYALQLLRNVGLLQVTLYGLENIFKTLYPLLWNHPSHYFRSDVAMLLSEFGLDDLAHKETLRKLDGKDNIARADALCAYIALELRGHHDVLLGILLSNPPEHLFSQTLRTFQYLGWSAAQVNNALKHAALNSAPNL